MTSGTRTWPTTSTAARSSPSGERIDQLPAAAPPGTVYDPDTDTVVQDELAAEAAATSAREAEIREAARIAARADELQVLRELGTLQQTDPREGEEAAREELIRRAGRYRPDRRRHLTRPRPGYRTRPRTCRAG
ncbi:hypothetical protein [Streptomyces sp. NPDC055632]